MDTKGVIHVMTNNIPGNWGLNEPVSGFVKCNTQKLVAKLKASTTIKLFMKTGSDSNSRRLEAVSSQKESTCATLPSPNTSSDDGEEDSKARPG